MSTATTEPVAGEALVRQVTVHDIVDGLELALITGQTHASRLLVASLRVWAETAKVADAPADAVGALVDELSDRCESCRQQLPPWVAREEVEGLDTCGAPWCVADVRRSAEEGRRQEACGACFPARFAIVQAGGARLDYDASVRQCPTCTPRCA